MTGLVIEPPLAERILAIAEQEQRPVEAVLEAMLGKYRFSMTTEEINARLRGLPGITVPPDDRGTPPITEEELAEIAGRAGAEGSLSALIIEERKKGW